MRPVSTVISAMLAWAGLIGWTGTAPLAQANGDNDANAINGTYAATSDGTYATTDYAFHNEATVRSTWTITSTCSTSERCTGEMRSDHGWRAPLHTVGRDWYGDH